MRSRLFPVLVVFSVALVVLFVEGRASAQSSFLDQPQAASVRLESLSVRVKMHGRLATTTMDMILASTRSDGEAIMQWQLPPGAVVHDLVLWVGELRIPCEVCPRRSARAAYDDVVNAKRDPAIVEYAGNGVWNLSVFPVIAGENRKVRMVYSQVAGSAKYPEYTPPRLTDASPTSRIVNLDFEADIAIPGGMTEFTSSRTMGVERFGGDPNRPARIIAGFRADKDLDANSMRFVCVPVKPLPRVLCAWAEADPNAPGGRDRVYLCDPNIPAAIVGPAARARNVVLVLDASGTMAGDPWKLAIAGAIKTLKRLTKHDRFGVVICGPEPKLWKDKLLAATAEHVGEALRMIDKLEPAGGTDLAGALRAAGSLAQTPAPVDFFVISDGWDQVGARYRKADAAADAGRTPARQAAPGRVFALDVAHGNEGLRELAKRTEGLVAFATEPAAIDKAVDVLLSQMRGTVVRDLQARVMDESGRTPAGPAELVAVHDLWPRLVGWTVAKDQASAGTRITATVNGRQVVVDCPLADMTVQDPNGLSAEDAEAVRRIYAHLKCVSEYPTGAKSVPTPERLLSLLKLCRRRHIASKGSALLVLESDLEYTDLGIDRMSTYATADLGLNMTEKINANASGKTPERLKQEAGFEKEVRKTLTDLLTKKKYDEAWAQCRYVQDAWDQRPAFRLYLDAMREYLGICLARQEQTSRVKAEHRAQPWAWYQTTASQAPAQIVPTAARFAADVTPQLTRPEQEKLAGLDRKTPEIKIETGNAGSAINALQLKACLDIRVSWHALGGAGVDKQNTIVTVTAPPGPARDSLQTILDAMKSTKPLAYVADAGSVLVTTKAELPYVPTVRLYDLRPILSGLPCYFPWDDSDAYGNRWGMSSGGGLFGSESSVGVFGSTSGGGGGIFGGGSWGPEYSPGTPVTLRARDRVGYEPGSAVMVSIQKVSGEPFVLDLPEQKGRYRDHYMRDIYGEINRLRKLFPDRSEVAFRVLNGILKSLPPDEAALSADLDMSTFIVPGTAAVRTSPTRQVAFARALRQLNEQMRNGKLTDSFLPRWPESVFTCSTAVEPWVAELLKKAREGKLSRYSSAKIYDLPGRRMVRIGGIWFDAALTADQKIYTVARESPAGRAVRKALGDHDECFKLEGPVIIPAGKAAAICIDTVGIRDADDPDLAPLLKALKPAAATMKTKGKQ